MPAEYLVVKEGCPPPAPFVSLVTVRALWLRRVYGQLSSAVRAGHYVYCSGAVGTMPDKKMVEGTVSAVLRSPCSRGGLMHEVQDRTRQVIRVSHLSTDLRTSPRSADDRISRPSLLAQA